MSAPTPPFLPCSAEGVTEGAANARENPRPLHHRLFGRWSPSPVLLGAWEERDVP
jgi:hypothetical protein